MLRLTQLEEIEGLLLDMGRLVGMQEERQPDFPERTVGWLRQLEAAFEADRLVESALIAGLRSAIDSANTGIVPPELTVRGQPTRTKLARLMSGQALQRAAEIGASVVASNRPRFAEAELVAQRLAAGLRSLDLLVPEDLVATHTEWLRAIRVVIASRPDLEPAMVHLEGLVGPSDSLIVLDRAITAGAVVSPLKPDMLFGAEARPRPAAERNKLEARS
jgi:hypothetical protein